MCPFQSKALKSEDKSRCSLPWALWKLFRGMGHHKMETREVKCLFHNMMSRVQTTNMTYHCWQWTWSPGWGNVYQGPPLWGYSPLFSHPVKNYVPWSLSNYINCPKFSYMWDVAIPSYLSIYSTIYISTDSWVFILCFGLQSDIPLFWCSHHSTLVIESSFAGPGVPLTSLCFLVFGVFYFLALP